jgi:hypothetical protein
MILKIFKIIKFDKNLVDFSYDPGKTSLTKYEKLFNNSMKV